MDTKYQSSGTANLAGIINKKYYGGNLQDEINKAKSYYGESGISKIGSGLDYGKIYQKIQYKSGNYEPQYNPKEDSITVFRQDDLQKRIQNWKNFVKQDPKEAELYATRNGFESANDLTKTIENPDYFRSVLEHEYGHPYSRGVGISNSGKSKDLYSVNSPKYTAEPVELSNGLGRIQRETYQITGRRFEDPTELKTFVESTPFDKATEGYSDEAKRTWRILYENKNTEKSKSKDQKENPIPLLEWASTIAPALVGINKQIDGIS